MVGGCIVDDGGLGGGVFVGGAIEDGGGGVFVGGAVEDGGGGAFVGGAVEDGGGNAGGTEVAGGFGLPLFPL